MPSLFNTLLRLQSRHTDRTPLEDYFTELFAYLLQDAPDILAAFLVRFKLTQLPGPVFASVQTQVRYSRLEEHEVGSRPDLVLQVESAGELGLVFIESKVGSEEIPGQLQRYAEHLAKQVGVSERVLVFITRDYEHKEAADILANVPDSGIQFVQLRWYDVYFFLNKGYSKNWLAREVCRFMEKNRMAQNLQFNPIDLLALTNFGQAKRMMDQTLDGAVLNRLQQFGGSGIKMGVAMQQFERQGRYILIADQLQGLWVGLGYFMPREDSLSYPRVGLTLEIDTRVDAESAKAIVEAMQAVAEGSADWSGTELTTTRQWVSINRQQPLQDYLHGENHLQQVTAYLLECLDAVEQVRKAYPLLPWSRKPTAISAGEEVL